ncbi:(2R)-sulfolactate sulfo-lyase subunit beta [subsurface metagenome]
MYKFFGYRRPNGTVGIRNYVGVIPAINCLNKMAKIIENRVNDTISFCHIGRCDYLGSDRDTVMKTLIGLGKNPNLGAVIVLEVGCENTSGSKIASEIKKTGKQVVEINLNNENSFKEALNKSIKICNKLSKEISNYKRVELDLSEMFLAIKCGGSDSTSGIIGNVITGEIADLIINAHGTVIFTENVEIIGAEHVLAKRAIDKKVAKRIIDVAKTTEKIMKVMGVDIRGSEPTPANIKGGLTTIEEKSLGAIIKSGTQSIKDVIDWGQKPNEKGLRFSRCSDASFFNGRRTSS